MKKRSVVLWATAPFMASLLSAGSAIAQNADEVELNNLIKTQSAQASQLGLTGDGAAAGGMDLQNLGGQLNNMGAGNLNMQNLGAIGRQLGNMGGGGNFNNTGNSSSGLGGSNSGGWGAGSLPGTNAGSGLNGIKNLLPAPGAAANATPGLGALEGIMQEAPSSIKIMEQNTEMVKELLQQP